MKNENSDLESPLSNEIWNALFNYCKKMQESISSLFYKITTNQVLNDLELLIFSLATKEKSIFSIQAKLQKPLDYFCKSINREYLQDKSQPKYQKEHKCDHDLMSHYDYSSNEFIHNQ